MTGVWCNARCRNWPRRSLPGKFEAVSAVARDLAVPLAERGMIFRQGRRSIAQQPAALRFHQGKEWSSPRRPGTASGTKSLTGIDELDSNPRRTRGAAGMPDSLGETASREKVLDLQRASKLPAPVRPSQA